MTCRHHNLPELFYKDKRLEVRLSGKQRPEEGEIIDILDAIYSFATTTRVPIDFRQALGLLRKWRIVLLTFYHKDYTKSITRTALSWKNEHPFLHSEEQEELDEVAQAIGAAGGLWGGGSQPDEVRMQSGDNDDDAPDRNLNHEDDNPLRDLVFFVRQSK